MEDFYDINDKDIDGMLNYLRIFQPEDATREFATEFLKYWKLTYRKTGRIDPDELPKQLEAFKNAKPNKEGL
jgi:hypothetical protein